MLLGDGRSEDVLEQVRPANLVLAELHMNGSMHSCFAPPAAVVGLPAAQVALGVGEDLDQALQSCLAAGDAVGALSDLLGQQSQ